MNRHLKPGEWERGLRVRIEKIVFLFLNQNIYDVGTQKNRLNETVLLITQNIHNDVGTQKNRLNETVLLSTQNIQMLRVLKRIVSLRRFVWAPKTYVKTDW